MIDLAPDEEQSLVVETVRAFAEKEIRPRAREWDEAFALDPAVLEQAHELGLVASALPEEVGGGGAWSAVTGSLIAEELAWGDLAAALAILSPALEALPLAEFGSEAQRRAWLPAFAGTSFAPGALAALEPGFRRNVFEPATRARREAGGFALSGRKCAVPWLPGGGSVLVSATAEDGPALFRVPRNAPGLRAASERYMGLQALPLVGLELAEVRVPEDARIGGGDCLRRLVARGRVALAACAVGVSRAAYEIAREYAKERHAFGAPIATKQAIAFKLADMATAVDGLRLLTWEAAWRLDRGEDALREATLAIDRARAISLEVADGAVQVLGGHGYTREYLPEMHLRNARGFAVLEALALV